MFVPVGLFLSAVLMTACLSGYLRLSHHLTKIGLKAGMDQKNFQTISDDYGRLRTIAARLITATCNLGGENLASLEGICLEVKMFGSEQCAKLSRNLIVM